jgi:hypothetical protein
MSNLLALSDSTVDYKMEFESARCLNKNSPIKRNCPDKDWEPPILYSSRGRRTSLNDSFMPKSAMPVQDVLKSRHSKQTFTTADNLRDKAPLSKGASSDISDRGPDNAYLTRRHSLMSTPPVLPAIAKVLLVSQTHGSQKSMHLSKTELPSTPERPIETTIILDVKPSEEKKDERKRDEKPASESDKEASEIPTDPNGAQAEKLSFTEQMDSFGFRRRLSLIHTLIKEPPVFNSPLVSPGLTIDEEVDVFFGPKTEEDSNGQIFLGDGTLDISSSSDCSVSFTNSMSSINSRNSMRKGRRVSFEMTTAPTFSSPLAL